MNLRINPDSVRFRLDAQDYLRLCESHSITQQTDLQQSLRLTYEVRFGELPVKNIGSDLHLKTTQSAQGLHFTLTVSAQAQAALATPNPTKQGIRDYQPTPTGELLTLVLERDVDHRSHAQR